jgi:peptidoglycan/LPS O-acetylase OafA/YrhL
MQFIMLDVLRGFASLSVLVYHTIAHLNWTSFPITGPLLWFRIGWMGVDLFFVVSGLVISISAFSLLENSKSFYTTFATHRFARIVPLYYATCLFFMIFIQPVLLFQPNFWANVCAHLLFVHNMNADFQGAIDGANWSLGVEMQFYVFVLVFAPLLRRAPWWSVAAACIAIAWSWRFYAFSTTNLSGALGVYHRFWKVTQLPGDLDEFAVGILLARMVVSSSGKRVYLFGQRYVIVPLVLAVCAMTAVLMFYWRYDATFWNSHIMVIPYRTALALALGCVVFAACCVGGRVVSFITAPARYLGTISYGIYLWQLPVILSIQRLPWLTPPRALPFIIALTVLLSACSWHFFEKPLQAKIKAALKARATKRIVLSGASQGAPSDGSVSASNAATAPG